MHDLFTAVTGVVAAAGAGEALDPATVAANAESMMSAVAASAFAAIVGGVSLYFVTQRRFVQLAGFLAVAATVGFVLADPSQMLDIGRGIAAALTGG